MPRPAPRRSVRRSGGEVGYLLPASGHRARARSPRRTRRRRRRARGRTPPSLARTGPARAPDSARAAYGWSPVSDPDRGARNRSTAGDRTSNDLSTDASRELIPAAGKCGDEEADGSKYEARRGGRLDPRREDGDDGDDGEDGEAR